MGTSSSRFSISRGLSSKTTRGYACRPPLGTLSGGPFLYRGLQNSSAGIGFEPLRPEKGCSEKCIQKNAKIKGGGGEGGERGGGCGRPRPGQLHQKKDLRSAKTSTNQQNSAPPQPWATFFFVVFFSPFFSLPLSSPSFPFSSVPFLLAFHFSSFLTRSPFS